MKMVHPDIEGPGDVLDRAQFNQIYAPRGWELMDPAAEYANDQLGRFVRSTDELTKDEARALIAARGGDYPAADADEAEVKNTYAEMFAGPQPRPAPATESAAGIPVKPYDPADHPVHPNDSGDQGVLRYLEQAGEDERQRVLELEATGQKRTTVLNWTPPDETDDSAPADDENQE